MSQKWNKNLSLKKDIIDKCKKIKPIDIMVGVLCKDVEATVLNVLNVINEGLYRYFPDYNKAIVICEGESTDKTIEAINLFQPSIKTTDFASALCAISKIVKTPAPLPPVIISFVTIFSILLYG